MKIRSNNRIKGNPALNGPKARPISTKINSVFNSVCEKSPFVSSIRCDVKESLGAFFTTRRTIVDTGKQSFHTEQNIGFLNKSGKFIATQGKGFVKGAAALAKKAGPIPAAFAAMGFCTAMPGGTSVGLTLGLVIKNAFKVITKMK